MSKFDLAARQSLIWLHVKIELGNVGLRKYTNIFVCIVCKQPRYTSAAMSLSYHDDWAYGQCDSIVSFTDSVVQRQDVQ